MATLGKITAALRWCMLAALAFVTLLTTLGASAAGNAPQAPEFTHADAGAWINSPPLRRHDLRGKVVLLDVWTFDCWNCYRSFPWLHNVEHRYRQRGLQVIGIHTPEFENERMRSNIVHKVREFKLPHPIMIDNDYSYWRALNNRYWPSFYLIDKRGRLRARYIGETHAGSAQADVIERTIESLLAEPE